MHRWLSGGPIQPIEIEDTDGDRFKVLLADESWETPRIVAEGGSHKVTVRLADEDRVALIRALGGMVAS